MSLGVYKELLIASYRLLSGRDTANGHDVEDRSNLGRGVDVKRGRKPNGK